jgi:ADP-glucose pyrophosphorylase
LRAAALTSPAGERQPASASARSAVVDTVVWPGATIGPDVELERCIVLTGAEVPAGLRARSCVITPASLRRPEDSAATTHDGVALFPF